jgi:hypothetical protein
MDPSALLSLASDAIGEYLDVRMAALRVYLRITNTLLSNSNSKC